MTAPHSNLGGRNAADIPPFIELTNAYHHQKVLLNLTMVREIIRTPEGKASIVFQKDNGWGEGHWITSEDYADVKAALVVWGA